MSDDAASANSGSSDHEIRVAALRELAKNDGMELLVHYLPNGEADNVIIGKGLAAEWSGPRITTALPPPLTEAVEEMARALRVSRDEVHRRAITLFKAAFDAGHEGNRLAILTPDDDIVRDIVGFRAAEPASPARN